MPSSRCAHTLSQNKKVERISNLVAFMKSATPTQLDTKLVDTWANPQTSITDARFLLVLGADPARLYENGYGEQILSERVESGSICEQCAPKFQSFLDNADKIYESQFGQTPIELSKKKSFGTNGLVTMSLDGGGMRGLVSVVCLLFASRRLFGDESLPSHIDWLVGTSTGSMLALALAKGYSLTETFFLYWEMKKVIFLDTGTLSRLFSNAVDKQTLMLDKTLGECFVDEDQFISCPRRVTVPALDVSTTPARLHVFRNYPILSADEIVEEVSFRDAARASSAAPTYFHPHVLNGRKLVDGSLVANCPLSVLFSEHDRRMKHGLKDNIACIISIGTGEPKHTERKYKSGSNFRQRSKHLLHLGELMFEQVVGHEQSVLDSCRDRCHAQQIPFVRISPSGINVRIDQIDDGKLMDMLWTTLLYLSEQVAEVDRLGSILLAQQQPQHHQHHNATAASASLETPLIENSRKRSNTVL
ncbi:hypothetical protein L596_006290 [Steinernema carpocapsae]|uniref:PNPLA domain-containing protein n=1 Tax=Steinernema carpocapsae TaxID=34508 RepID=A0A4U8V7U7_STECR|nr:hypothetical protein L596_006290 [Steinernema carpocapsae]